MSSNPTGGFLIKFFPHSLFGEVYFHVRLHIVCLFRFFVYFFVVVLYCFVFFFYITMKFQDASCPSLAVVVLSSSVEHRQSLAVSVSFLNAGFDRATFPLIHSPD